MEEKFDVKKSKEVITVTEEKQDITIKEALMKKALGYKVSEVVEEYSMIDDKLVLVKKKVNTKEFPPDLDAIELALNSSDYKSDYEEFSDLELLEEKQKLIEMLDKFKKGEKCDDSKKN